MKLREDVTFKVHLNEGDLESNEVTMLPVNETEPQNIQKRKTRDGDDGAGSGPSKKPKFEGEPVESNTLSDGTEDESVESDISSDGTERKPAGSDILSDETILEEMEHAGYTIPPEIEGWTSLTPVRISFP
jgi:hypothetical protein